jgi:tetratricopeptide (TPR) repeat protein
MPVFEPTPPGDIDRAAGLILAEVPSQWFVARIAAALQAPTPVAIRDATAALIVGEKLELAERICALFWDRSDLGPWARFNMARRFELGGEFARAITILNEAIEHFPEGALPHWWVTRARCERALDRFRDAETTLRDAVARFPGSSYALASLADLLASEGRAAEATSVWSDVIQRFPGEAKTHWHVGLSSALRASGRPEEAHQALEEMARALPDEPRAIAALARSVGERRDWPRALELWTQCRDRDPSLAVETARGRARALFKLWRVEEALAIWRDLAIRRPDLIWVHRDLGAAAVELGDDALARVCHETLIEQFPDEARPEWYSTLARGMNDRREYADADRALAELERRFPESPLASREHIRKAYEIELGQDEISLLVDDAVRRFPEDPELLREKINVLLGFGRWEEAEKVVESLEALGAARLALHCRLMVEAERDGDASAIPKVRKLVEGRDPPLEEGMSLAGFLLGLASSEAIELGCSLLEALRERNPCNIHVTRGHARALVTLRRDERAIEVIETIPPLFQGEPVLELRAWAAARRGEDAESKRLWRIMLDSRYFPAAHYRVEGLARLTPEGREIARGGVTAYVVFRNEAPQIPGFLEHHRRVGVGRFVFIDHESDDGSREMLLEEPDVILYHCPDSYQLSSSGRRWMKELIDREGARGWNLQVDVDESFIYPGWENISIDRFTNYLDERGFEGVRAFMLDVFPKSLLDGTGAPTPRDQYRYYDADYTWLGQPRAPYLVPTGGVRERLFGAREDLHKTPLWRAESGTVINSHEISHIRIADVSGALLHYKLFNVALRGRGVRGEIDGPSFLEPDSSIRVMRRHSRYAARLAAVWRADLFKPGVSAELTDSLTLADRGLMSAPADYREWLRAQLPTARRAS